jgi:hypothetical protein
METADSIDSARNGSLSDLPCVYAWPNPYKANFVVHP